MFLKSKGFLFTLSQFSREISSSHTTSSLLSPCSLNVKQDTEVQTDQRGQSQTTHIDKKSTLPIEVSGRRAP